MKIPGVPSAKSVSNKRLTNIWKKISDNPLPEMHAFTLNDRDFFFLLDKIQKTPGVKDTRVKEYGVDFDNRFIEAFSFKAKGHFLILIKQSASLGASLEHELRHIISETSERKKTRN
jgi:hypothetical protein